MGDDFEIETPVEDPAPRVNPPSRPQPRGHFVQLSTPTAFSPQPLALDVEMPTTVGPPPTQMQEAPRPTAPPVPSSMMIGSPPPAAPPDGFRGQASFPAGAPTPRGGPAAAEPFRHGPPVAEPFRQGAPAAEPRRHGHGGTDPLRPSPPAAEAFRPNPPAAEAFRPSPPAAEPFRPSPPAAEAFRPNPSEPFRAPSSRQPLVAAGASAPNVAQHAANPSPLGMVTAGHLGMSGPSSMTQMMQVPQPQGPTALRAEPPRELRPAAAHVVRSRAYSFILDARGMPIEIGSGRFAKVYLGEERWLESKTDYRREVVIKILQRGVSEEDHMRFAFEKELLERVQGHPNIVELMASGEGDDLDFVPHVIRDKVESEFMILERLEMSLEERLKGSRTKGKKDDLLAGEPRERLFRVLDYVIPVASAVEYAHLVRNMCHRDIKPANVLIGLPNPNLRGSTLEVRLADFNVAKIRDEDINFGMTHMKAVPGTLFFQSPEQETNIIELLVNTQQGLPEIEYFEDFYIQIAKNDTFSLFNRGESYPILYADRGRKRLVLARPYRDASETNVRAKIQKSVGRPADIYSLGAMLYYLISGAYANPKTLYDAFHKFIEYERADENNTIDAYLQHEYSVINSLRAPKQNEAGVEVAPADRFFSYKHYLDGNGELIDPHVMKIIARCMIRNKPDSYCQAHDLETRGISELVQDLIDLYAVYGVHPAARPANLARRAHAGASRNVIVRSLAGVGSGIRWIFGGFLNLFRSKK